MNLEDYAFHLIQEDAINGKEYLHIPLNVWPKLKGKKEVINGYLHWSSNLLIHQELGIFQKIPIKFIPKNQCLEIIKDHTNKSIEHIGLSVNAVRNI
ncbi:MAG: hypothetical protein OXR68_08405 [Alphaproteobacteria bacterium]|nr:hypothetical protein [Alphaproteobacteria bacterium]